jgi:uncharacterized protein YbjT (DUF2867 family)
MTAVLLAGGTGLVGGLVTERLLVRHGVGLASLVRSGSGRPHERVVDFEALANDPEATVRAMKLAPVDVGISTLGTTIAKAGTQAAFRRVDFDYVVAAARAAQALGARRFIVVTSVGARLGGTNFYLSVKGDVEAALARLAFDRLDVLRPGLILGPREDRRPAEALGQKAARVLNPLLWQVAPNYAAIPAEDVADAIVALTEMTRPGKGIHHNPQIRRLAGG